MESVEDFLLDVWHLIIIPLIIYLLSGVIMLSTQFQTASDESTAWMLLICLWFVLYICIVAGYIFLEER